MPSFRAAAATGCDGIELDVQLSRDGELVIIHDETVARTTGAEGRVRDLSLEELRRLDAGAKGPRPAGGSETARIPSFSEYLDFAAGLPLVTNVELKNYVYEYPGLEEKVIAALRERGMEGKAVLSSFNHQSLMRCRRLAPEIEVAFIAGGWLIGAGEYCERNGARYINPRYSFLTPANLAELREHGVLAMAWTVNEAAEVARLGAAGVDSIITNEPEMALRVLGR